MTDILFQHKKTDKQFAFAANLHWLQDNMCVMEAAGVNGQLHIATPEKFGGTGADWSAEHLFLGAICSSFMTTYIAYTKKMQFNITHFEIDVIGQIQIIKGIYQFTHINIYPKIFIINKLLKLKATQALKKTQKNCLVANTIKAAIIYHPEIITDEKSTKSPIKLKNYRDTRITN